MADLSNKSYTSLPVWCVRSESEGMYLFGVTLDGADVVLAGRKLGGVDSDIESARLAQQQRAEQQAQQQPGPTPVTPNEQQQPQTTATPEQQQG